ncbi:hypothetical protein B7R77_03135 [Ralstonia solanacearum K60]|uniref:DUF4376 domain-containing protein n=1 Tax=Ralstonia solanacearum K60 TaxID=1091042 RepID=A0AAP8D354_RALSL|nr:DUF4376 domain-containing protein [Ralstonia solanacearum]OYQ12349.1 hypothetical protein B7R77_03135 [Ralstonia solanacearum K60]CCF96550.1 conserved hypothetical protein [Ralstonia solanacearum K60]
MGYQLGEKNIVRLDDNAIIPMDPANSDYQAYLAWVDAGNTAALPPAETLADAQAAQIALVESAYQRAIQQSVSYMGAEFQADLDAQTVLTKTLAPGAVPSGFFWLDSSNNAVQMTFAQLQGLAGAMLVQGQLAFAKKTGLKQKIRSATTIADVQAITWS